MTGKGTLRLPAVDNKADIFSHVEGCTYGYSDKPQTEEYGTIKYFGDTECEFTHDTTLYRVLNVYGGGKGTKENPYIISYYDHLLRLAEQGAKGFFIQTEDIPMSELSDNELTDIIRETVNKKAKSILDSLDGIDKFYVNKENESVTWVYFNPDSSSGGQLVYNTFTYDQLLSITSMFRWL